MVEVNEMLVSKCEMKISRRTSQATRKRKGIFCFFGFEAHASPYSPQRFRISTINGSQSWHHKPMNREVGKERKEIRNGASDRTPYHFALNRHAQLTKVCKVFGSKVLAS